jgi:hypothetical protein
LSSLLAMLYLILFATLALGFYASTTTQTQVVANDTNGMRASLAAETGVDFVRYHLMQVSIPAMTSEANLMQEVFDDLVPLLNGSGNMDGQTISINSARNEIQIPGGADQYIALQNGVGPRFRASITQVGRDLVVRAVGNSGASASRAGSLGGMQLTFKTEQFPGTLFKNGMAGKGPILLDGVRVINGIPASMASVMSTLDAANSITIGSGNTSNPGGVAGTITAIAGRTPVIRTGATVSGTANVTTILDTHTTYVPASEAPEIPTADTSIYKPFATNTYVPGNTYYENIVIEPMGTVTFAAGTVIKGVVYIKQPNIVNFNGNVSITGVIVSENNGLGIPGVTNTVTFSGNGGSKQGVQSLPDDPQFLGLKALGGGPFIVAPQFQVNLTGNFGSVNGHVVGDGVTITGSSNASFTGSAITLNPTKTLRVGGAATLTFTEDPTLGYPGLRFREKLYPDANSYKDFRP